MKRLTYDEVMKMSANGITNISDDVLRRMANTLRDVANKRIKRLKDKGKTTPAIESLPYYIQNHGFTINDANPDELRDIFTYERNFLRNETSKIRSWNKIENSLKSELLNNPNKKIVIDETGKPKISDRDYQYLSVGEVKDFWKVYNRFLEIKPQVTSESPSTKIQEMLHDMMIDGYANSDELLSNLSSRMDKKYEETQREYQSTSDFFEIDNE